MNCLRRSNGRASENSYRCDDGASVPRYLHLPHHIVAVNIALARERREVVRMPVPSPAEYDRLPTVTKLRSRAVIAYLANGSIWEIGWNGIWVRCWAGLWPPAQDDGGQRD